MLIDILFQHVIKLFVLNIIIVIVIVDTIVIIVIIIGYWYQHNSFVRVLLFAILILVVNNLPCIFITTPIFFAWLFLFCIVDLY